MKLKKINYESEVKPCGNSGHIPAPKNTIGRKAKVAIE